MKTVLTKRSTNTLYFAVGIALGCLSTIAAAQVAAAVNTNGILKGYVVQKDGVEICRDPSVWLEFDGPESYIICD